MQKYQKPNKSGAMGVNVAGGVGALTVSAAASVLSNFKAQGVGSRVQFATDGKGQPMVMSSVGVMVLEGANDKDMEIMHNHEGVLHVEADRVIHLDD